MQPRQLIIVMEGNVSVGGVVKHPGVEQSPTGAAIEKATIGRVERRYRGVRVMYDTVLETIDQRCD